MLQQYQGLIQNNWVHDEGKKCRQEIDQKANDFNKELQKFLINQNAQKILECKAFNIINQAQKQSQNTYQNNQKQDKQDLSNPIFCLSSVCHKETQNTLPNDQEYKQKDFTQSISFQPCHIEIETKKIMQNDQQNENIDQTQSTLGMSSLCQRENSDKYQNDSNREDNYLNLPLKNYRNHMFQTKNNEKLPNNFIHQECSRDLYQFNSTQSKCLVQNQAQDFIANQKPQQPQQIFSNIKQIVIPTPLKIKLLKQELNEYFEIPEFGYFDGDVFNFSSKYMYGHLKFDNFYSLERVKTDRYGMILLEGFINKNIRQDFELWIEKKSDDFYVEIGVIDWNNFKFPKKDTPQKGVYSYNSRGEIFNDEELRQRNLMIQNETILVTYYRNCQSIIFTQSNHNQAICLQNVNKNKLTFFVRMYQASATLCEFDDEEDYKDYEDYEYDEDDEDEEDDEDDLYDQYDQDDEDNEDNQLDEADQGNENTEDDEEDWVYY